MATALLSNHNNALHSNQSVTKQRMATNNSVKNTQSQQQTSRMQPRLIASFSVRTFASHPRSKCTPTGLHVTKKGDFVVVDNSEKRVKIFSKMGRLLEEFGESRLKSPWNATYLPENSQIAVSDPGDNTIKVFGKDGTFVREFSGAKHLQEPYGITLTTNSEILVADKGANCFYVHDKDGFAMNSIKSPNTEKAMFEWAQYVTTDSNGNIYITDKERKCVKGFTEKGELLFCYKGEDTNMDPRGIVVDKFGHVVIADGNNASIILLSNQGEYIQQLITRREGLGTPSALAINKDDQLLVADVASEEIKVFSYLG